MITFSIHLFLSMLCEHSVYTDLFCSWYDAFLTDSANPCISFYTVFKLKDNTQF